MLIYDKTEHIAQYLPQECRAAAELFFKQLTQDTPCGLYELMGQRMYARVMEYGTSQPELCRIEAHDRYVDIQASIVGAEGISVYDRGGLKIQQAYAPEADVVFFEPGDCPPLARSVNVPGYFTMLFPEDAHRPQEMAGHTDQVKKVVVKVEATLWERR